MKVTDWSKTGVSDVCRVGSIYLQFCIP